LDGDNVTLVIAFAAGILSFASPCVLPLVPIYLGHMVNVASVRPGRRERVLTLAHAAAFVGGFSLVFIVFWTSLAAVGFALLDNARYMREVAGAVLVFMGLHLLGVINIPFMERQYTLNAEAKSPGYPRSFLMGVTFAAGWTPCIGPVLGSIIGLALTEGTPQNVAPLLLAYSAGMGVPFLGVALAADPISGWMKRRTRARALAPVASGVLVVAVGLLMVTNSLIRMNEYFTFGRYG
jgi:cytochrome c-type biogenesis protein